MKRYIAGGWVKGVFKGRWKCIADSLSEHNKGTAQIMSLFTRRTEFALEQEVINFAPMSSNWIEVGGFPKVLTGK